MIQAQALPPGKSVYDYPAVPPGQEPTAEQQQQIVLAQIAGTVMAVATAKATLEAAITNQLIAVLRTTDLATEAGIAAFIAAVKVLIPAARDKSREVTWAGFAVRAALAGVDFPSVMPETEDLPQELRYPRSSSLENAYRRVADEYAENKARTKDDPIIQELIEQFETQGLTPLPRPDNLSSDAVQKVVESDTDWVQAFRKAEKEALEALEDSRRKDAEAKVPEAVREVVETSPSDGEWHSVDVEAFAGDDTPDAERALANREEARREAEKPRGETEDERVTPPDDEVDEDGEDDRVVELTDREIDEIIERYAEHKAEERVERMVSQEVQGTARNTHQAAMRSTDPRQVKGYRRVVHPELSESGRSCGLCIVASTMTYKRGDLMPIHSGCNCETAEIYVVDGVEYDPGHQINLQDLAIFYDEAGRSTHGWDLKRQRYEVFDHPEYGPTLINATSKKARENATEVEFNSRS